MKPHFEECKDGVYFFIQWQINFHEEKKRECHPREGGDPERLLKPGFLLSQK